MYCEIPIFKRCCCCLPLRGGLIGYGYLRLAALYAYMTLIIMMLPSIHPIGWIIIAMIVLIDTGMNLTFIIGGHMKRPQPLKVYMWYIIVTTAMVILFQLFVLFNSAARYNEQIIVSLALDVVIQMYLVFLIRSEVLKLEAQSCLAHYIMPEESVDFKPENV